MKRSDLAELLKAGRQLVIKHGLAKNPSEWSDWSERVGIALRGESKPGETEEIVREAQAVIEDELLPRVDLIKPEARERVEKALERIERWLA